MKSLILSVLVVLTVVTTTFGQRPHLPPPRPRVVVVPPCPMAGMVLVAGHWRWHQGHYVWVNPRWHHPPRVVVVHPRHRRCW